MPPTFTPDIQPTILKYTDQILLACVYGAFTLYGKTFQSISTSLRRILNQDLQHHIFTCITTGNSVCPTTVFARRYSRYRNLLSFPLLTKMFQFSRFPLLTEHSLKNRKTH